MVKRKGIWSVLESILAGVILMLFLFALSTISINVSKGPNSIILLGYEQLKDIDRTDSLRNCAETFNNTCIDSMIKIDEYNHTVLVCDSEGICTGEIPSSSNIWSASYYIAGNASFSPREVRLYLWEDA